MGSVRRSLVILLVAMFYLALVLGESLDSPILGLVIVAMMAKELVQSHTVRIRLASRQNTRYGGL